MNGEKYIMILSDIKKYFSQNTTLDLQTLSLHFDTEPDAMRGMLEHWIRKGKVRKQIVKNCAKGCSICDPTGMEIYEWIRK